MTEKPKTAGGRVPAKDGKSDPDPNDLDIFAVLARSSDDHEAYRLVARCGRSRVGLVVKAPPNGTPTYRIEVLLQFFEPGATLRIEDLERMNEIAERFNKRGYTLVHHDGSWVMCEREVEVDDVAKECLAARTILHYLRDAGNGRVR